MSKLDIPLWEKAVLSVEEAAEYGNMSPQIIRGHAHLASLGKSNLPVFWVGCAVKIHREEFCEWLKELAMGHHRLEVKTVAAIVEQATQPVKPGRPRKGVSKSVTS
jgi:hypothetical protein